MNYKKLGKILGKIMILEAILMIAPLVVSLIYKESLRNNIAFIIPIIILTIIGFSLQSLKPKRNDLYQKEGFALTALVWIIMTLFGAIPFVINGDIPNYIDACFEIMSGFTTTGASIVEDITALSQSTLFSRSFSHWIGGMGILLHMQINRQRKAFSARWFIRIIQHTAPRGKAGQKKSLTSVRRDGSAGDHIDAAL